MKKNQSGIIPFQRSGIFINSENSVAFENAHEAKSFFKIVKDRLFHPNRWHDLAGWATAHFILTDGSGKEVKRKVNKGDHFKIDIPGPGTVSGQGYDWVKVEAIEEMENENDEEAAIRVRPAPNPLNVQTDIAHFFTEESTSSFIVRRNNKKVTAGIFGRNERPNISSENIIDKARNAAIAAGAISGFAKLQWESLVNGLLQLPSE